jgi:hypothetical protein
LEPVVPFSPKGALDAPRDVGKANAKDNKMASIPAVGISGLNGCEVRGVSLLLSCCKAVLLIPPSTMLDFSLADEYFL